MTISTRPRSHVEQKDDGPTVVPGYDRIGRRSLDDSESLRRSARAAAEVAD